MLWKRLIRRLAAMAAVFALCAMVAIAQQDVNWDSKTPQERQKYLEETLKIQGLKAENVFVGLSMGQIGVRLKKNQEPIVLASDSPKIFFLVAEDGNYQEIRGADRSTFKLAKGDVWTSSGIVWQLRRAKAEGSLSMEGGGTSKFEGDEMRQMKITQSGQQETISYAIDSSKPFKIEDRVILPLLADSEKPQEGIKAVRAVVVSVLPQWIALKGDAFMLTANGEQYVVEMPLASKIPSPGTVKAEPLFLGPSSMQLYPNIRVMQQLEFEGRKGAMVVSTLMGEISEQKFNKPVVLAEDPRQCSEGESCVSIKREGSEQKALIIAAREHENFRVYFASPEQHTSLGRVDSFAALSGVFLREGDVTLRGLLPASVTVTKFAPKGSSLAQNDPRFNIYSEILFAYPSTVHLEYLQYPDMTLVDYCRENCQDNLDWRPTKSRGMISRAFPQQKHKWGTVP